jgi:uncharacterized repeat protein (TIGR01451 family)
MRISWRPGNARVRIVLAAGLIAIPAVALPGGAALAAPVTGAPHRPVGVTQPVVPATDSPHPSVSVRQPVVPVTGAPHRSVSVTQPAAPVTGSPQPAASLRQSAARVRQPAVPGLTVSVSDGRTAVQPGDQLTYLVSVRDAGVHGAPHLKITQTLSQGLQFLSASSQGVAANRQVTWNASIPAGGTRTFSMVARVTRTPASLLQLAAVACVATMGGSRPIVCAAHLDRLPAAAAAAASRAAGPTRAALLTYAAGALAVLVAGVLAAIAYRRLRTRRRLPELRSEGRTRMKSRHE